MIQDILQLSKENKKLIGFYFYGASTFFCGYVLNYNDEFITIQHYTKFGVQDGLLVKKISDIKYFETETDYINGINYLIENPKKLFTQTYKFTEYENEDSDFTSLFEDLIGNKSYMLKFEMNDEEIYFGFLEWCDEESFAIINIDVDGLVLGKAIFKFEDLKLYWIDDLECRKRTLFYQMRNTKS